MRKRMTSLLLTLVMLLSLVPAMGVTASAAETWETVTTYDVGLDVGLLNNRLNFTGDYYIRDTKDMLTTSLTLPSVFGANTPKANCADLRTKGWEISLSWQDEFQLALLVPRIGFRG